MRIALLGGTRFIGRAIAVELAAAGHELCLIHRGETEPADLPAAQHAHMDRGDRGLRDVIAATRADALIDCYALGRADADAALAAAPPRARLLVLSSMDVYRAYSMLRAGGDGDPVPLDESSPVRSERYPYRGKLPGFDDYEKLDVEEAYLARGATVCRLPMVYGEHDYQRREEFILRRVRAGRARIPFGAGNWLWSRGYAGDIARAVRLAVEHDTSGQVLNLGERRTASMERWARDILEAAGATAELVRIPDSALPGDLELTGAVGQHMLVDSSKARALLGWEPEDPHVTLRRSVAWHLAHPPPEPELDFAADDRALASIES